MTSVACRYAVLQFSPYRETGEFANAGVVLLCPATGFFDFKLQTQRTKRITDFFDPLPREVYVRAIAAMRDELQRVAQVAMQIPAPGRMDALRQLFEALTRPREAMLRFGHPRTVLTTDPVAELARQFEHCVQRSFVTPEYVEQAMEKNIRQLLQGLHLAAPFGARQLGDEVFHANFPLVQQQDGKASKVIKPLRLNHGAPVDIYTHGDVWLQKIKRLRSRNHLPQAVLFALRPPESDDAQRQGAYQEICTELQGLEVQTVLDSATSDITAFAQS
jgi:hypothetical protein